MHENPYESPDGTNEPPDDYVAARARFRDRLSLVLVALGIFGSIMALVVVAALFRLFG